MTDLQQDWHCQNACLTSATKARLEIGERRQASTLVLVPVGRIDNFTSAEFQKRLLAAVTSGSTDVVIDFSGVDYISSCGLHALMTALRQKSKESGSP
jgi:anti-anti-sigma factor